MKKTTTKNIRMAPRTARDLNVIAAKTGLPLGDLLAALVNLYKAQEYFTEPEYKALFKKVWAQAVLLVKQSGKSGWTDDPDPHQVDIEIE